MTLAASVRHRGPARRVGSARSRPTATASRTGRHHLPHGRRGGKARRVGSGIADFSFTRCARRPRCTGTGVVSLRRGTRQRLEWWAQCRARRDRACSGGNSHPTWPGASRPRSRCSRLAPLRPSTARRYLQSNRDQRVPTRVHRGVILRNDPLLRSTAPIEADASHVHGFLACATLRHVHPPTTLANRCAQRRNDQRRRPELSCLDRRQGGTLRDGS